MQLLNISRPTAPNYSLVAAQLGALGSLTFQPQRFWSVLTQLVAAAGLWMGFRLAFFVVLSSLRSSGKSSSVR